MRLSILHKTPLLESKAEIVAQRIAEHVCGFGASESALADIGADVILNRLKWFQEQGADIFQKTGSAMGRLEKANQLAAARKRNDGVGAKPRAMEGLTDSDRAFLKTLPAEHRAAYADGAYFVEKKNA